MSCPVCEGQGNIYKAKVIDLRIEIKICDECEARWTKNQTISIEKFKGLVPLLEEYGCEYKKGTLEDLGYMEK